MQKKLLQVFAVLALMLFMAAPLCAKPWGIVATQPDYYADNESDNQSIHTIDLGQTPPVVYGPFLQDELSDGSKGAAYDIVMLPGNKKALLATITSLRRTLIGAEISQVPSTSRINLIDLKDPTNPFLEDYITLPGEATDIAITKDGKTAIVCLTGAEFGKGDTSKTAYMPSAVAFINLRDFSLTNIVYLNEFSNGMDAVAADGYSMSAESVAISSKNIAIFTDFSNSAIHYGKINKARNGLESVRTIYLCEGAPDNMTDCFSQPGQPVNVEISPNGRTALVAPGYGGAVFVFEITSRGDLIPGVPFILTGLPGGSFDLMDSQGGQLSIAFQNNAKAYVVSYLYPVGGQNQAPPDVNGMRPDQLCEIKINGPGRAEYVTARFNLLNSNYIFPIFGFESLSIFNRYALVGNNGLAPVETTVNPYYNPYYNNVAFIDLLTGVLTPIELNNYGIGSGVAIKP